MTENIYIEPGEIAIKSPDELRNIQHLYQTGVVRRIARTSVEYYYYGLYYQRKNPVVAASYFEQGYNKGCLLCAYLYAEIHIYDNTSFQYFKLVAKHGPAHPQTTNDPVYRARQKAIFCLVRHHLDEPSWKGAKRAEKYGFPELAQVIRESLTRPSQSFFHRLLSVPPQHLNTSCQNEKTDYLEELINDLTNRNTYFRHRCVSDICQLIKQYF